MFRRWWLTVFLAIQFLPWPSSDLLIGRVQSAGIPSQANAECDRVSHEESRTTKSFTYYLSPLHNDWEVICEADAESFEKEMDSQAEEWLVSDFTCGNFHQADLEIEAASRLAGFTINCDGFTAIKQLVIQKC